MTTHTGYLLIADISGYTAYLTSSEQDHANPILRSLLTAMVEQVGDPLHLWRMEGDAVLAYSTRQDFPSGEGFLSICENLYNSFATRRRNIIANTTCDCRACANVQGLDLKIMAHYGAFEEMEFGPMKDISGADVILVHRMAKTDVKVKTGIASYALFTDAAVEAMKIGAALVPYTESFEHFGETRMQVYDLAKAWDGFRAQEEHHFLDEADGVYTYRHHVAHPPALVWEALVNPELKRQWMGMRSVSVERQGGRIGISSGYHCVHEAMEFKYWVTDWQPFRYFSTRIGAPMDPSQKQDEIYELIPTETGTEIRYTCSQLLDADGVHQPENEAAILELLSGFWPPAFDALEELINGWT